RDTGDRGDHWPNAPTSVAVETFAIRCGSRRNQRPPHQKIRSITTVKATIETRRIGHMIGPPLRKLSMMKLLLQPLTSGVGAAVAAGLNVAVTVAPGAAAPAGEAPTGPAGDIPGAPGGTPAGGCIGAPGCEGAPGGCCAGAPAWAGAPAAGRHGGGGGGGAGRG